MRQFIVDCVPDKDGLIYISGKDFKYIRHVLRLCVGDMINVLSTSDKNDDNKTFDATICKIDDIKKIVVLQICSLPTTENCNSIEQKNKSLFETEFWLLQFIPKPQKMELIIRQAVECGVSKIIPIIGEYTQKGSEKSLIQKSATDKTFDRQNRISRIIKEAMQQSGSKIDTKVLEPCLLQDAINIVRSRVQASKNINKESVLVTLYEKNQSSKTMTQVVKDKLVNAKVDFAVLVVGSEGGISPIEIDILKESCFEIVHFNTNILRCETASLYGMASLQTRIMEE